MRRDIHYCYFFRKYVAVIIAKSVQLKSHFCRHGKRDMSTEAQGQYYIFHGRCGQKWLFCIVQFLLQQIQHTIHICGTASDPC